MVEADLYLEEAELCSFDEATGNIEVDKELFDEYVENTYIKIQFVDDNAENTYLYVMKYETEDAIGMEFIGVAGEGD